MTRPSLLKEIGYAEQQLGNIDRATQLYEEALINCPDVPEEKGSLLHFIGLLKKQQGYTAEALSLLEQSLALKTREGNRAATLHELAGLKAQQGDVEGAIALFQQSLEIKEKIGDAQGKAATLWWLGHLAANAQNKPDQALVYLQESFEIFQRIGSPDAAQVQTLIGQVKTQDT